MLSETPSEASTSISLRPTSASSRASSAVVAELLSTQLLDIYNSHWLIYPLGEHLERLFRNAGGKSETLDVPSRVRSSLSGAEWLGYSQF
mgnify:CR=1 FL=1